MKSILIRTKKETLFIIRLAQSTFYILVVLLFTMKAFGQAEKLDRPNIIFIFSDDHANRTISSYGAGINNTPNIDRIAEEGAIFQNNFCGNSIYGPSRATILTGQHSHKNSVTETLLDGIARNKYCFPE
ncbi:sulfatase-like hydrolase/transferase [Parapedobacter tibetensis]|uniref:sulfatase-like hydrolase/transferase n=1 Tax=Parapedobacter tibetensis TaxID=2972951 RepID=UPI00214D4CCB|nr:sulfatase-like hydrolase/transferase [Parapedobacter tibetensis]